jgi:hypothetical protein
MVSNCIGSLGVSHSSCSCGSYSSNLRPAGSLGAAASNVHGEPWRLADSLVECHTTAAAGAAVAAAVVAAAAELPALEL